jgi:DNA-binding IclR family transcriptional regulator
MAGSLRAGRENPASIAKLICIVRIHFVIVKCICVRQTVIPEVTMAVDQDRAERGQRAVQSVEVGGRLLLALAASRLPMSLKDLAAQAGLSASRAHPYLVSFGRLRLIEQDATSGHYALGQAALQLGLTCLVQLDALKVATPIAQQLADSSGLAVALAVWGNFGPTVVRMIDARQPLHVSMRAGTVMSILGTATGRAFAAWLPKHQLE